MPQAAPTALQPMPLLRVLPAPHSLVEVGSSSAERRDADPSMARPLVTAHRAATSADQAAVSSKLICIRSSRLLQELALPEPDTVVLPG